VSDIKLVRAAKVLVKTARVIHGLSKNHWHFFHRTGSPERDTRLVRLAVARGGKLPGLLLLILRNSHLNAQYFLAHTGDTLADPSPIPKPVVSQGLVGDVARGVG